MIDPIKFESCGNHLRNLLTPYANLICLVEHLNNKEIDRKMFEKLTKDCQKGLDAIIEFSKSDKMEQLNWREG